MRRPPSARIALLALLLVAVIGPAGFVCSAKSQPAQMTQAQADAVAAYDNALSQFRAVLAERRAQIDAKQPLPNIPGQALYLARINVMSTYKDLTDAIPSRIGRPNKFGVPPAYFDAAIEPLIDEYLRLFGIMQAPPANAQNSDTPFEDVARLGTAIARAKGLDAANADAAGRISLGMFFAETNGKQNIGNARSNTYKGSFQTGPSEDRSGQHKWAAFKDKIAAFDPALIARDAKEEARAGSSRPSLQSLDRGARRPDERACRSVSANPGDCQGPARPDRPDEAVRADPDRAEPDQGRNRVRQYHGLPCFRSADHGLSAQQQPSSRSARPTAPEHPPAIAKSSMRCGCSTTSSRTRWRSSTRSGAGRRASAPST